MNAPAVRFAALMSFIVLAASSHVEAATNSTGPYYATPSWDQQLPTASRFITLTDWGGAAVLDRETGLVWQTTLELSLGLSNGFLGSAETCLLSRAGGRGGWRLPTIQEVMRTLVSASGLIAGTPFAFIGQGSPILWTSTPDGYGFQWAVVVGTSDFHAGKSDPAKDFASAWCVQSPAPGSAVIP